MPKARTVKTNRKKPKLTGKGFKDVAKKVAKVAIPIALAVAGAVAAKKLHRINGAPGPVARMHDRESRAFHIWHEKLGNDASHFERRIQWPEDAD